MRSGLGTIFWKSRTDSIGGGSYVQVLDSPRSHQVVSGFKNKLLVALHEARDSIVCREMLDLSDG